ncbi:hypothetical protein KC207_04930 [Phycicoccus sp. BSK3Z-2]|uniref:Uncharacterized protein n=1 Tax=Phycicoccus avicenniae TaxID=2828860 RepID=A0A941D681_9MICO|nr:hypothetical protein [Phycicoccus avicenniae]MBR7742630.1 hypothetical protein [Phycicoccus avicenniae]
MSLSLCVLDPSRAPDSVQMWRFGEDDVPVSGRLGGPEVVGRLRPSLRADSRIVVLHRPADHAGAALLANVVSGALPAVPVTRLPVTSSLLAATVIALEAAHVEGEGDLARLARIPQTLDVTVSGAWLRRVTRLDDPSPSFGQHLRSIFPWGPRFVARCGPDGRVVKAEPAGFDGSGTGRLVVGAPEGSPGVDRLVAWFGSDAVVHVPPVVADVRGVYGNPGVEFAVVDEFLAAPGPRTARCPVCREPMHADTCPFCHVRPDSREVPAA